MPRAYGHLAIGDEKAALADARRAVALHPQQGIFNDALGDMLCRNQQIEAAIAAWKRSRARHKAVPRYKQLMLRRYKFYKGEIRDAFGPEADTAIRAWAEAGCPYILTGMTLFSP